MEGKVEGGRKGRREREEKEERRGCEVSLRKVQLKVERIGS